MSVFVSVIGAVYMLNLRQNKAIMGGIPSIIHDFVSIFFPVAIIAHPQSIEPAEALLPSDSPAAGVSLFEYERRQLTEEVVQLIRNQESTAKYSNLFAFGNLTSPILNNNTCKSFPDDLSWPQEDAWNIFDSLLGGALIPTIPSAASCYKNWGLYNEEKCAAVIGNWYTPDFQFVSPSQQQHLPCSFSN